MGTSLRAVDYPFFAAGRMNLASDRPDIRRPGRARRPAAGVSVMKVLIVDDDALSLALLLHAVRSSGHEAIVASDGESALRILRHEPCPVVITDWEMPGLTGPELVRRVRTGQSSGYTYILMITGRECRKDMIEGLSAGADEFIVKPVDQTELTVRLRTAERVVSQVTRDLTIFALAKLAESRDHETGAHLERVRTYSESLARALSTNSKYSTTVTDEFIRLIRETSPLHDIGKVGVPDSVLLKPARLSDREYAIMKTHTTIGAETLDAVLREQPNAPYLIMSRDIALSHHERFDGQGYPNGVGGTEIPLSGRIVAVADVYDALTSKRVYKAAMPHEVARGIIMEGIGTHFDPDIITAFVACEAQFFEIRDRLEEGPPAPRATAAAA